MAGEINRKGEVIPPRNITKPAPILDIHGFQWRGVERPSSQTIPAGVGSSAQHVLGAAPGVLGDNKAIASEAVMRGQLGLDATREPLLDYPLDVFTGSYAGNGFNMIFRPRPHFIKPADTGDGNPDNTLQLNLTTEQWTFGPTLGEVPNRGTESQDDINLGGLPYLQTVQDVTNVATGKGDKLPTNKPNGIHLEPGVFLMVPPSAASDQKTTIVRMASIPHGTTINAQGIAPTKNDKQPGSPDFINKHAANAKPFIIGNPKGVRLDKGTFQSMDIDQPNKTLRVPEGDLSKFSDKNGGTGRITTAMIENPNLVLQKANEGLKMVDHVAFTVRTSSAKDPGDPGFQADGEETPGIANIAFLKPNANVEFMTSTFFVENVLYDVIVPGPLAPFETVKEVWATMPQVSVPGDTTGKLQPSLAPTPVFSITAGPGGMPEAKKTIQVLGTQLQYTQAVSLNFAGLTWPHMSVATIVPTTPQPRAME
ncbi:hypothetical protein OQA88_8525 [Cercophora sp. LCS_1]